MRQVHSAHSIFIFVVAAACLVVPAQPTVACSCIPPGMSEAFQSSQQIFLGTAVAIVPAPPGDWSGYTLVLLSPEKFWKGEKETKVIPILDPGNDGICRFGFTLGDTYLVYASWNAHLGAFTTSLCTRTARFVAGLPDIPFLDRVVSIENTTWSAIKRTYRQAEP